MMRVNRQGNQFWNNIWNFSFWIVSQINLANLKQNIALNFILINSPIKSYMLEMKNFAKEHGFVETFFEEKFQLKV